MLAVATLLGLALAMQGQHMNEKSAPCAGPMSNAEMTQCFSSAAQRADIDLNTIYKKLRSRLDSSDVERLLRTQRLWIQYRDANCAAEQAL